MGAAFSAFNLERVSRLQGKPQQELPRRQALAPGALQFGQDGTVAIWNPAAGTGRCISFSGSSYDGGTWSIAAKDPSAWAAIVPMCSGPDAANAAKFAAARLPVWNFCGDKDREGTVKANRTMHEALTKAGAIAKYTEYPGVGHNCWDDAYGTDALYTWLLEQSK